MGIAIGLALATAVLQAAVGLAMILAWDARVTRRILGLTPAAMMAGRSFVVQAGLWHLGMAVVLAAAAAVDGGPVLWPILGVIVATSLQATLAHARNAVLFGAIPALATLVAAILT